MKHKIHALRPHILNLMKISALIFSVLAFSSSVLLASKSNAQKISEVKISVRQNSIPLDQAIQQLQQLSKFNFLYNTNTINGQRIVSMDAKNKTVKQILDQLFRNTDIYYQQSKEQVYLEKRADPGKITGTVRDSISGELLPGVNIMVNNRTYQTGTDGEFSITVPAGVYKMEFRYLGYDQKVYPSFIVKEGITSALKVKLFALPGQLNEVTVIGYGTQKKETITGAISKVTAENFNQGATRNAMDLIAGKVSGLTITRANGNNPNAGASIQLRGVISLNGSNSPLIVVDGIPGGNLDLLQPDDIESFDVLKDGAAAAIYGTRGSGGVILVTTKKGSEGPPEYEYSTWFSRDVVTKRPDILSAAEYRALKADPTNTRAGSMTDLGDNVDWYSLLLNPDNLSQYHDFAASGGTAKSNYRASVYYRNDEGVTIDNNRKQYGGRINVNQLGLKDRLATQLNLATNFNNANLDGGNNDDFEQAVIRNPTEPVYENGTFRDPVNGTSSYNPLARLMSDDNNREQQTFSGDLKFTLNLVKGLKISAFGALVSDRRTDGRYIDRDSRVSKTSYNGAGYASKASALNFDKTFESTINYTAFVHNDHSLNALAGYSYQFFKDESFNVSNSGFTTDAFQDNNLNAGTAFTSSSLRQGAGLGSSMNSNIIIAFFGRLNYAFKDKYLAQVSLRHEGSSRFGANHKWGNFPSVSAGWNISKEDFMAGAKAVNNLKLRIGYGVTGNNVSSNYLSIPTLSTGGVYPIDGVWNQTYGPSRNPNPDLRWEKKKETNIGVDFSLFNNRLGGSVDVFNRITEDLIAAYNTQLPPFIYPTVTTNVGSIQNKGIELTLNAIPVKTKNFSWSTNVLFNAYSNTLKALSDDVYKATFLSYGNLPAPGNLGSAIRTEEGKALGGFYGKRFAGFTDDGKWLFYKADGSKATTAEMTNDDLAYIGNGVPKWMLSWGNTFTYRNLELTIFFRGKFAYNILNTPNMYFGNLTGWLPNNVLHYAIDNRQINDGIQYSDYYLENGNFVKLDNLTLRYNFKLKTAYIHDLSVFATGRNVLTITKYKGLDPEIQDTGLTPGIDNRGFYPRTRTWTLGLKVGF